MQIANVEMAKAWDGDEGAQWAEHADRYERSSARYSKHLLDAAALTSTDDVLDVGCGTGKSTRDAARAAGAGSVLGVDLSARMLAVARERAAAEGVTNVRFEQADAQVHPFEEATFDVVMSNFGAMFFHDPVAAFTNIGRAMRRGARLALLAWRDLASNEWVAAVREALAVGRALPEPKPGAPGPFGLADRDVTESILTAAGFGAVRLERVEEPVQFGVDLEDAFRFTATMGIVRGLTQDLDDAMKAVALDQLHRTLAEHEAGDGVLLGSSAWLITATRP